MTISNPLGSLGFSPQVLPDMTAGVQALQKTEIQRQLRDIEQNKAWERDDRLRNQKLALEFSDVGAFDSLRQQQIESFMQKKDAYIETAAKVFSSGKTPTTKDLMMLQTERQKLLNETMQEKSFTEAFQKAQASVPTMRKSLETQEQRDQFDRQIAQFTMRLKDPKQKVETYDLIQAFQPPEPPTSYLVNQTAKELLPFVDASLKSVGGGKTAVDYDKLTTAIKARMGNDDYLFKRGVLEGAWKSPDEMYKVVADQIAPSIKTDIVGWKPNEPTEKEKFEGIVGRATAANVSGKTPNYTTDNAYISTNWGTPISVTTKEGLIGEFTPKQSFPNGMVQGTVKVSREVAGKERDYTSVVDDQAMQPGSRIEVTATDAKGEPTKAKLITKSVVERTEEVPWNEYGDVLAKRDPNMAKYFQSQGVGIAEQSKGDIPMKRGTTKKVNEVIKVDPKTGRKVVFDADTKKAIRYAE